MAKYKLRQFAELETFPNVYHHLQTQKEVEYFAMRGLWLKDNFKNNHPLVLELGCGKGEYTTAMAMAFEDKNFIIEVGRFLVEETQTLYLHVICKKKTGQSIYLLFE